MAKAKKIELETEEKVLPTELATLEQEDINKLVEANRIFQDETIRYNIINDGIRSLAKAIQDKYKLPDLYNLDVATGKVYAKED